MYYYVLCVTATSDSIYYSRALWSSCASLQWCLFKCPPHPRLHTDPLLFVASVYVHFNLHWHGILFPFFYVGLLFRSRRNDLAQSLCQLGFVSSWSINPFIVYSILINISRNLHVQSWRWNSPCLSFLATESILYNESGEQCPRLSAKPNTSKRNNHRRERCSTTSCRTQIDPRGNNDHHMGT